MAKETRIEPKEWYRTHRTKIFVVAGVIGTIALGTLSYLYFGGDVARQSSSLNLDITLGVTYVAGNKNRDILSKLVVDNHLKYAQRWSIAQEVVTNNLVQGACTVNGKAVDCEPHWNKIAVIRRWLSTAGPENKEKWYIITDDDMPITNMRINPVTAIDSLRKGVDTSVIVAKDAEAWTGDPSTSINTGVLIVRKDDASRALFENIWQRRNQVVPNGPEYCPTLGYCKKQHALHEQQALASYLKEVGQRVWSKVISVISQREMDENSPRYDIAINTFHRSGCFIPADNLNRYLRYNDRISGKWTKGDWMGQATGIPLFGYLDCNKDSAPRQLRLEWLQQMLNQVIE